MNGPDDAADARRGGNDFAWMVDGMARTETIANMIFNNPITGTWCRYIVGGTEEGKVNQHNSGLGYRL